MFKTGDVVRLKSGGPQMTVVETREIPRSHFAAEASATTEVVEVAWFPSFAQEKKTTFRPEMLDKCEDSDALLRACTRWIDKNKSGDAGAIKLLNSIRSHLLSRTGD